MNFFRNPGGLLNFNRKQVQVFYLSFSFCSLSFLSFSALASSASCFLMSSSTSFCFRTLILVLPFSRVSVAISTAKISRKQSDVFFHESRFWIYWSNIGNTLLEGVCIRLTWHLHTHDICYEYEGSFMHVSQCHSLSYDILYTNMMLFEMSLWQLDITKTTQPVINMT